MERLDRIKEYLQWGHFICGQKMPTCAIYATVFSTNKIK
jgi:hypothetical protein